MRYLFPRAEIKSILAMKKKQIHVEYLVCMFFRVKTRSRIVLYLRLSLFYMTYPNITIITSSFFISLEGVRSTTRSVVGIWNKLKVEGRTELGVGQKTGGEKSVTREKCGRKVSCVYTTNREAGHGELFYKKIYHMKCHLFYSHRGAHTGDANGSYDGHVTVMYRTLMTATSVINVFLMSVTINRKNMTVIFHLHSSNFF